MLVTLIKTVYNTRIFCLDEKERLNLFKILLHSLSSFAECDFLTFLERSLALSFYVHTRSVTWLKWLEYSLSPAHQQTHSRTLSRPHTEFSLYPLWLQILQFQLRWTLAASVYCRWMEANISELSRFFEFWWAALSDTVLRSVIICCQHNCGSVPPLSYTI